MAFLAPVLPALIVGGGLAAANKAMADSEKKAQKKAQTENDRVKAEAEAKSVIAAQEEQKTSSARRRLLATPTQGFGPNTNLARSFLTSL